MKHAVGSICSLLATCVVIAAILYSCSDASNKYYAAQKDCTSQGGSWIASGQGTYTANCVFGRSK